MQKEIVFFFSNIMVVFSSDNEKAFAFNQNAYSMLVSFISNHEDVMKLYENEVHVLSHLLYTRIDDLIPVIQGGKYIPGISLLPSDQFRLTKRFFDDYTANNKKMYDLIDRSPDQYAFVQVVSTAFQSDDQILTLLKKAELAEARENYQEETQLMFELKKQAEFRINLQDYVRNMLQYKEKFFYNAALRLENNRKWEEAKQLYLAVLAINPDNFDANYRIGLLYITLQDIDSSFRYLQEAMRINRDHPKALFQMGVLYFSSGRIAEAIMYFNRALEQNEKSPSIFRYLGLCYEKLKNLSEAERYYTKAIIADPNDVDTKSRLDEVRSQIKKENKKWETPEQRNESDVEQDADMPLPVSKGAYDIRLKDNDTTLPVIDPVTGNEIPPDSKQESMGAGK